jgi:hypothetical protein
LPFSIINRLQVSGPSLFFFGEVSPGFFHVNALKVLTMQDY